MAVGCGPKIAKFILIVFNILFWLSGLILIIIGSVYLANGTLTILDDVINSSTNRNILIGFIIIGSIIFVIGFCGCCGAIKESRFLLAFYIIFVIIIIVAEVAFGIYAIIRRQPIEDEFKSKLKEGVEKFYGRNDTTVNKTVDSVQQVFQCCGVVKPADWIESDWYKNRTNIQDNYPLSCRESMAKNGTLFETGCVDKMEQYVKKYFPVVIGVALGIALFEIFVVICAFCLCRNKDIHSQSV